MGKVILYIATSLDKFIVDKGCGVFWVSKSSTDDTDGLEYKAFIKRISIIAMGSRSYKQVLGFGDWGWANQ